MNKKSESSVGQIWTTGVAMFSMFFGAGNVVFSLGIGQYAQDLTIYAVLGLLLTAVIVPFMGIMAMALYDGDYNAFFNRMGKKTGFLIILAIMGLIGPFGALPRCIALSYSTTNLFIPSLSIEWFSFASCVAIFLFTIRKNNVLDVIGRYLSPFLLGSLTIIIIVGLWIADTLPVSDLNRFSVFIEGLKDGYQTMDLLGAFFFSSVIVIGLRSHLGLDTKLGEGRESKEQYKQMVIHTLKASFVGATLLALIYVGFAFVAAYHSNIHAEASKDQLIGLIAIATLGQYAGVVASFAVALVCITTAIALAAVTADFIEEDLSFGKIPYWLALVITLIASYFVSILNFDGIAKILVPILVIAYPSLILLSVLNILHKLYGVKVVKTPVAALFLLSLLNHFFQWY